MLSPGGDQTVRGPVAGVGILEDFGPNSSLAIRRSGRDVDQNCSTRLDPDARLDRGEFSLTWAFVGGSDDFVVAPDQQLNKCKLSH